MTRTLSLVILLCLALLIPVGCSKDPAPSQPAPPSRGQSDAPLVDAGLKVFWEHRISLNPHEQVKDVYYLGDRLYFITSEQLIRAYDANAGLSKWAHPVSRHSETIFPPVHVDNMRLSQVPLGVDTILQPPSLADMPLFNAVMINTPTRLLVIDRDSGKLYRDFKFDVFTATNRGDSDGTFYYVASSFRLFYAVRLLTGASRWKKQIHSGEIIKAPILCQAGKYYVGTMDGSLQCLLIGEASTPTWTLALDGAIDTPFHVDFRGLYVATANGRIHGLNPNTGERLWYAASVDGRPAGPLHASQASLFQYVQGVGMVCVDLTTGAIRWTKPAARQVLTVIDGQACLIDKSNNLLIVDETTGKVAHTVPMARFEHYATNMKSDAIIAVTDDGRVVCIRPAKAEALKWQDLKNR
jgi:glucose dehydrogenase